MFDLDERKAVSARLVCNNYRRNVKVIKEIEDNMYNCDSFDLSVAFISESGLASLQQTLLDAIHRGVKGRIVTSTYLGFNNPKMFDKMFRLFNGTNIEVRIYQRSGFHPKGYIFKSKNYRNIIIGSSNITQDALSTNQEWNICLSGDEKDEIYTKIDNEFTEQWNDSIKITLDWIKNYKDSYLPPIKYYVAENGKKVFEPNKMQIEALESLNVIRKKGKKKALLISATGTGKTYLSAFDIKQFKAKKVLFVVHRETIAENALDSYRKIIPDRKMGMFTGSNKCYDCDFLFSTINTIGKEEYLLKFNREDFDYIVIDEVHRAGAKMYVKLLDYFRPKFLLGMSATPERTDDPQKIYELFDYNVAYEIRLKQAMEFNLLCPFHYYGISDLSINGETIDDKSDFNRLTDLDRLNHIISSIETYGYFGDKPHGLIFVSRSEEAKELSRLFNKYTHYRTLALTSDNSNDEDRKEAISKLEEKDTGKEYLDYIFTVDLFNEGIDIPCLNQIVMIRKTESSIIFIQQLGRGLRKHDDKEYVTVIDLIGNYDNNYMIPIALSGSQKYNKDELRKFVYDSNCGLPGASTISFDMITKTRIYNSIDSAKLNSMIILKEEYQKLKARLGNSIPKLSDFDKYSSIDPLLLINAKGSYYGFLEYCEKDYHIRLNDVEKKYLKYVSLKFASGKRIHELEALKNLLFDDCKVIESLELTLQNKYNRKLDSKIIRTLVNELTGNFNVGSGEKYEDIVFIEKDEEDYIISKQFRNMIRNNEFVKLLSETIEFGIQRYVDNYSNTYLDTDLVLYQKYSYDDVYRLLNWEKSEVSLNVGGYKYDEYSNTFPVFINYDKTLAADSIKYQDEFIDQSHINALSKHPRRIDSTDAQIINDAEKNNTKIHMFVRKNKLDDKKEFYYLGLVEKCGNFTSIKDSNNQDEFVIPYKFETKVREDIYSYICD